MVFIVISIPPSSLPNKDTGHGLYRCQLDMVVIVSSIPPPSSLPNKDTGHDLHCYQYTTAFIPPQQMLPAEYGLHCYQYTTPYIPP